MSCGVGYRHGSDPALLWLWCRLAATAPIRQLAWEPPYAAGAALKGLKTKKKKKRQAPSFYNEEKGSEVKLRDGVQTERKSDLCWQV